MSNEKPLAGRKILILVANGFDEAAFAETQRTLLAAGAKPVTVSPENGLVNGWHGAAWGHYFPVDSQIGDTLAADFDGAVLPGGERSIAKLQGNPHARRIVSHLLDGRKPLAAVGEGVQLLTLGRIKGLEIAARDAAWLGESGAVAIAEPQHKDGMLLSTTGEDLPAFIAALVEFLLTPVEEMQDAA